MPSYLDLRQAGINDDLEATVNYVEVYTLIKELVEEREYNLMEGWRRRLPTPVTAYSQEVTVRVRNPSRPLVVSCCGRD